jgi:hypothetical protein
MSRSRAQRTFASSAAKDYVRHVVDRDILRGFRNEYYPGQQLAYLGLPGEAILDILSWREFIGYCTAVEESESTLSALELNVLKNHLEGMVYPVRANIDELLSTEAGRSRLHWPYHIVNLDYYGGLVNCKGNRESKRLEALKGLLAKQRDVAFVLFLTLNLRDKDRGELDDLVQQQEEDLRAIDPEGVRTCFANHRELGHAGLLKIYVPVFLLNEAKRHSLEFLPPILYRGTQQMVHFVVQCTPYTTLGAGRVLSNRDRVAEINKPLLLLRKPGELESIPLGRIDIGDAGVA